MARARAQAAKRGLRGDGRLRAAPRLISLPSPCSVVGHAASSSPKSGPPPLLFPRPRVLARAWMRRFADIG